MEVIKAMDRQRGKSKWDSKDLSGSCTRDRQHAGGSEERKPGSTQMKLGVSSLVFWG